MTDEKTAPVKPRRDTERDSGPIAYDSRNGKLTVKTSAIFLLVASLIGGGSFFGFKASAPDPEMVKATANDVGEIKMSLAELNATLRALADNSSRDRSEWERRFADQQKAIDDLKVSVPTVKEVDALERRVAELERKVK